MLDINVGKNKKLMENCRYLKDYCAFVGKVKEYRKDSNLSTAIDKAIEYCIKRDIMKDVLEKHRSEVARLIFREFDEAEFLQQQQRETENLREKVKLAEEEAMRSKERAEQSEQQTKLAIEEAEQSKKQTKLAIEETQRLRKILEAHGWVD